MGIFLMPLSLLSLVLTGGIFGFFYAWTCSTMWGLDQTDPRVAITAMQAMNASVRNVVFAPAFFGAPVMLLLTALVCWRARAGRSALWFALAGAVYLIGGLILTLQVHVPLNEGLAQVAPPASTEEATRIWEDYSPAWQFWNQIRTVTSGVALCCAGLAIMALPGRRA